jgi:hypothetical protein
LEDVKAKRGGIAAGNVKKIRSVLFFMDNSVLKGLIDALCETVGHNSSFRSPNLVSVKALSN